VKTVTETEMKIISVKTENSEKIYRCYGIVENSLQFYATFCVFSEFHWDFTVAFVHRHCVMRMLLIHIVFHSLLVVYCVCDTYVFEGDVQEDGQDPIAVCRLSAVRGTVLDAFSEWKATHWTCGTVGVVCHWTGSHNDTARPR